MLRFISAVSALALILSVPALTHPARAADETPPPAAAEAAPAKAESSAPAEAKAEAPAKPAEPKADSVLATVNGETITYAELQSFMDGLDPQVKMIPLQAIYPNLLNVMINSRLLAQAGAKAGLDKSGEAKFRLDHAKLEIELISPTEKVAARVAQAREKILRDTYIQTQIDQRITRKQLEDAFAAEMKDKPPVERHLRHILVKTEDEAKTVIKQLDEGADFAKLADEKTTDKGTKGGDLGWQASDAMLVKPFLDAAFALESGKHSAAPVQTQFGWHVIKVEAERTVEIKYEDKAPELLKQAQMKLADEVVDGLRKDAKIEMFDLAGKPMAEPAAKAADKPAADAPAADKPAADKK